jgi:hypothetical protein
MDGGSVWCARGNFFTEHHYHKMTTKKKTPAKKKAPPVAAAAPCSASELADRIANEIGQGFRLPNSGMGDGYCPIFDKFTDPDHGKRCTAFQPNVKGHASPEHAPKIDQTASSASHVPTCYPSSD